MTEPRLIEQSYGFVLAPRREQEAYLRQCLGASRFWFNQALGEVKARLDRRRDGEDVSVPWSYRALCSELHAAWRNERAPWQAELPCGTYMAAFEALGAALQRFSDAREAGCRVGFPRFRKRGRCTESVLFQKATFLDARRVQLHGRLGPLRSKESIRNLIRLLERDECARVQRAMLSRRGGQWVLSVTVRRAPKRRRARQPAVAVGCDVGLRRLATLHTGELFVNRRPLSHALTRLRRLQRQLDRQRRANNPHNYNPDGTCKKGARGWVRSNRQAETERLIAKVHARVANIRREQAHLLTTQLTREFGIIGVEALHVKGLLKNRRLARHIADVGWGLVLAQLKYKTDRSEGSLLVLADRYYPSSKICSACGSVKAKLDRDVTFTCEQCGAFIDRDVNAALNLARVALSGARARGYNDVRLAVPAATEAARGATDPEVRTHRSRAGRATAVNRKGPFGGSTGTDEVLALAP